MAPPRPRKAGIAFRDVLIIRLLSALTIATFFQPDEYFQSLEPAWNLAFGSESGSWLTWVSVHSDILPIDADNEQEWDYQLRSSLHPMLFAIPYTIVDHTARFLEPLGFSTALRSSMLIAAPAILQGLIAALGDWYTFKLASCIYGPSSLNANITVSFMSNTLHVFITYISSSCCNWSAPGSGTAHRALFPTRWRRPSPPWH